MHEQLELLGSKSGMASLSIESLHVIGGGKLGGAELFYVRLVNALAKHQEGVGALVVRDGEIDAALSSQVVKQYAGLSGVWDLWSRVRINQTVQRLAPKIVQTYMGRATRLTHLSRKGRPVHIARLGGYYNLKGYRHAHAWVGNTRGICDYLTRGGLPAERVFHIGNFVDIPARVESQHLALLREQWSIPVDAYVILGLGRLHPNKGFDDLLKAFSTLPVSLHERQLRLVMVGDGPLGAELKQLAEQLDIADRVTWTGWQYQPAPWYQLADVFVCSSRHEPLGNVVLEAWANKTPVVTTKAEGPMEFVNEGQDALLAPLNNPQALASAILNMLCAREIDRRKLTEAGFNKLQIHFGEQAIVSSYLELYQQLQK